MKLFLKPLSSIITVSSGSSAHTLTNKQKNPQKTNKKEMNIKEVGQIEKL